ncbi:MAG: hypothetical protein ABI113_06515 [Mucilaginibacter sp.]
MSALYVLENAWYLPAANTWKEFQTLAMKDIGILTVDTKGIFYRGGDYSLVIDRLSSVTYGKQGRDFINNWVKIEYIDANNNSQEAYFADGNNRGWSGIFGGTKKLYDLLKEIYS